MPLFTLSDNIAYTTNYSKFESYGFPLMFMPQNKHIYFGSPHETTCYDFSCAELSLSNNVNTYKGDLFVNSGQPTKKFVSGISVDDHNIICTYNSITLPTASNGLIYSQLDNTIGHYNELEPDSVNALGGVTYLKSGEKFYSYEIEYDNNGHITDNYANEVFMPTSEITLSSDENTYTAITSILQSSTTYIQFKETSANSNVITSRLKLVARNLLTTYSTSANEINLNVNKNIFEVDNAKPVSFYLDPTSYNLVSSDTTNIPKLYNYQTLYNETYWHKWQNNSLSSLSSIFDFNIYNGRINYIKFKLFFYDFAGKTIELNHITVSGGIASALTPHISFVVPNNSYEYILTINHNVTDSFSIDFYCSSMSSTSYILMQILNINDVDVNNSIQSLDNGEFGNPLGVKRKNCNVRYVLNSGINLQSTHGDSFRLVSKTDTEFDSSTGNSSIIKNTNGIIFYKDSNLNNNILAYSYHSTKSTNTTVSYIPKTISYDMFGHVTGITKTTAGIQDIRSLTQTQYDNLPSKNPYTLYLIT